MVDFNNQKIYCHVDKWSEGGWQEGKNKMLSGIGRMGAKEAMRDYIDERNEEFRTTFIP